MGKLWFNRGGDILFSKISCVKPHKSSIINIGLQFSTGYIFSCAKKRFLVISEMNYQSVVKGNV